MTCACPVARRARRPGHGGRRRPARPDRSDASRRPAAGHRAPVAVGAAARADRAHRGGAGRALPARAPHRERQRLRRRARSSGCSRGIYRFHTGPSKGWPDIAYNFFVDRFGTVYEGRTGSLAGAEGRRRHRGQPGLRPAVRVRRRPQHACRRRTRRVASMAALLAFLGDRHGLDLSPGATTTFMSRGSNRQPAGPRSPRRRSAATAT